MRHQKNPTNLQLHLFFLHFVRQAEFQAVLDRAISSPGDFVLKPQREGGGNNFFDDELVDKLRSLSPEELKVSKRIYSRVNILSFFKKRRAAAQRKKEEEKGCCSAMYGLTESYCHHRDTF